MIEGDMHMNYGDILTELRKDSGFTQKQVADQLHLSKSTVSNYENSIHFPPYDILVKLCGLYHVSSDYILGITDCRTEIDVLSQKLPNGYTIGDLAEIILYSDEEYKAHLVKYLEYSNPQLKMIQKKRNAQKKRS